MICAVLVFQTPDLPAPLGELSPWLDHLVESREGVYARLAAQRHRRFIKTHTPLDGIPLDPRATYVVVARHPLDMAVSIYHQGDNIDRARLRQLTGAPDPASPGSSRPALRDWLLAWIESEADPRQSMDSLPGAMWHLSDAWRRRGEPNVLLIHYDDLLADLEGQMRRVADRLGMDVAAGTWPGLVEVATFEHMKAHADHLVPDRKGVLKSNAAFFRRGRSGAARELLADAQLATYRARCEQLGPPDLLAWLHRPG